jgi:hypothetical protein
MKALWERAQSDDYLRARCLLAFQRGEDGPRALVGAYDHVKRRAEEAQYREFILQFLAGMSGKQ